jgi:transcriptional regulator with XRE-family HTH domain
MAPQRTTHLTAVPEPHEAQRRIATSIKALASIQGITHARLAADAGIEATALSKALKATRKMSVDELGRIAVALDAPLQILYLGGDEIKRRAMAGVFASTDTSPDDPSEQVNQTFPCKTERTLQLVA